MRTTTRAALAAFMYDALYALGVGAVVPVSVYISDYKDGTVPRWTVVAREDAGPTGVLLELEDPESGAGARACQLVLFAEDKGHVRTCVLAFPTKVLRGPHYMSSGDCRMNALCDLVQNAEKAGRGLAVAERGVA